MYGITVLLFKLFLNLLTFLSIVRGSRLLLIEFAVSCVMDNAPSLLVSHCPCVYLRKKKAINCYFFVRVLTRNVNIPSNESVIPAKTSF